MNKDQTKASLILFITAIIWGLGYVGVELSLINGWSPFPILFIRTLVGGLALLPIAIRRKKPTKKQVLGAALCGLCGFLGLAFQSFGQMITTVSNTAFITSLYIVFTPVCAQFISKKHESIKVYLCCILSVIGCFLLNMNYPFTFDTDHFLGNILAFIGAIMFALQIVFITKFTQGTDTIVLTTVELFSQSLYSFILMFVTFNFECSLKGLPWVVLTGVLASGLCSFFQMYGNKRLPESLSGLIQGTEAIFGTIFAIMFFNERLDLIKWIGCLLMLLGAVFGQLILYKKEKRNKLNGMRS